jgi:hypothetical protein
MKIPSLEKSHLLSQVELKLTFRNENVLVYLQNPRIRFSQIDGQVPNKPGTQHGMPGLDE